MTMTTRTITIIHRERPYSDELEENLQWLLSSLGVADAMLERYAKILEHMAKGSLNATELSEILGDPRTSVSYHVGKLVDMGLLVKEGRSYRLRAATFLRSIEEVERDIIRMFEDLKKVARTIDEKMGLPRR